MGVLHSLLVDIDVTVLYKLTHSLLIKVTRWLADMYAAVHVFTRNPVCCVAVNYPLEKNPLDNLILASPKYCRELQQLWNLVHVRFYMFDILRFEFTLHCNIGGHNRATSILHTKTCVEYSLIFLWIPMQVTWVAWQLLNSSNHGPIIVLSQAFTTAFGMSTSGMSGTVW